MLSLFLTAAILADELPDMEHLPPLEEDFEFEDPPPPHEPPAEELLENAHMKAMLKDNLDSSQWRVLSDIAELEGIAQPTENVLDLLNKFDDIIGEVDAFAAVQCFLIFFFPQG